MQIGELLVSKNLITGDDLNAALETQKNWGSKIGSILLGSGKIRSYKFYQALAEQKGLPFADLEKDSADKELLHAEDRDEYLKFGFIPWKKEGGKILIATYNPSPELEKFLAEKYGNYSFVITSNFDIYRTVQKSFATEDDEDSREKLYSIKPEYSAKYLFTNSFEKKILALLLAAIIFLSFFNGFLAAFFIIINLFYVVTLFFKLTFFGVGFMADRNAKLHKNVTSIELKDKALPIYTLLIPLYKEKRETISGLITSIKSLDYPLSKLDVKLIVEIDDSETIEAIKSLNPESFFEIISVPYSLPRTKPKACNYALRFAKGELVTIYDAEDRPDSAQLKKVIQKFSESPPEIVCVQARLNYYNRDENILTKMFALEYSSWFDFMLLGLEAMEIPIPLGGTSNHFRIEVLRELYAWDPYNVTEDADLGLRLAQKGYKTAIIDSTTMEEAPIGLKSWMGQRTRWIKGYMQTYMVHMRQAGNLFQKIGFKGILGFIFFVGAPSIVFLTVPFVFFLSTIAYFKGDIFPAWFLDLANLNFILGVFFHVVIALVVIDKNKWWGMLPIAAIFPFYWILHIITSFRAVWQLMTRPHFWYKTEHGLTKLPLRSS